MDKKATVVNLRREAYDVYIGRPGRGQDGYFGNPFTVQEHGAKALTLYARYFKDRLALDGEFRGRVILLEGKRLGCFCKPRPCHGDIIAEWVNEMASITDSDESLARFLSDNPLTPVEEEECDRVVESVKRRLRE